MMNRLVVVIISSTWIVGMGACGYGDNTDGLDDVNIEQSSSEITGAYGSLNSPYLHFPAAVTVEQIRLRWDGPDQFPSHTYLSGFMIAPDGFMTVAHGTMNLIDNACLGYGYCGPAPVSPYYHKTAYLAIKAYVFRNGQKVCITGTNGLDCDFRWVLAGYNHYFQTMPKWKFDYDQAVMWAYWGDFTGMSFSDCNYGELVPGDDSACYARILTTHSGFGGSLDGQFVGSGLMKSGAAWPPGYPSTGYFTMYYRDSSSYLPTFSGNAFTYTPGVFYPRICGGDSGGGFFARSSETGDNRTFVAAIQSGIMAGDASYCLTSSEDSRAFMTAVADYGSKQALIEDLLGDCWDYVTPNGQTYMRCW
jgi:hypothetical protein